MSVGEVKFLRKLKGKLSQCATLSKKCFALEACDRVQKVLQTKPGLAAFLAESSEDVRFLFLQLIALGQHARLFFGFEEYGERVPLLIDLLKKLQSFYEEIGGILGYHLTVIEKFAVSEQINQVPKAHYLSPPRLDLTKETRRGQEAFFEGLLALPTMGEIYTVGGAGERLHLTDPVTSEPLPVAALEFCGSSLLEGLIRDLQAREYLYYRLFGKRLTTPVALMVSEEKNNAAKVLKLFEENHFFGRPKRSFCFFTQPQVPVITQQGKWVMEGPLQPLLKPGGHGVIWKLAQQEGVFDWFFEKGRTHALVRQINNPLAGSDGGLLALAGVGYSQKKAFGFLSCERQIGACEGMNVLLERKTDTGFSYALSNIEYTDSAQQSIEENESARSAYPANTNILFVDLKAVDASLSKCPLPGLLVNAKTRVAEIDAQGGLKTLKGGRLEATMQNLSDAFVLHSQNQEWTDLPTFLILNHRNKTISVTKKAYQPGSSPKETPLGAFWDLMANHRILLKEECGFQVPEQEPEKKPSCCFLFHPALGPLWSVIAQKIRGGRMERGSLWVQEVVEADVKDLHVKGQFHLLAEAPLKGAYCILHNVIVRDSVKILLRGQSALVARDVVLEGPLDLEVLDGCCLHLFIEAGKLKKKQVPLKQKEIWNYRQRDKKIQLERVLTVGNS